VASYFTTKLSEELLPALSVQLPLLVAAAVSGPEYVSGARQESIPDPPGSEPAQLIDSGALYQPAPLAGRLGLAAVVGACVSYLTTKVRVELFPARSLQLPLTDVPFVSGPL